MKSKVRPESSVVFIDEEQSQSLLSEAWKEETLMPNSKSNEEKQKLTTVRGKNRSRQRTTFRSVNEGYTKRSSVYDGSCSQYPSTFWKYLFSEQSILMRLIASLIPPFGQFNRVSVDLQGSFLSWFLLTCTLYWGFYSKGETRLYALASSCMHTTVYIIFLSCFTWVFSLCTKTRVSMRQVVCILSYGLFGHSVTLLVCELGSDQWFLPLLTVLGGLDSLRICLIIFSRTPIPACRFVLCTPVATIHLLYLVYLHFAVMRDEEFENDK